MACLAVAPTFATATDFLFGGGFESGTTCAWSSASPTFDACSVSAALGELDAAQTAPAIRDALSKELELGWAAGSLADPSIASMLSAMAAAAAAPTLAEHGIDLRKGLLTIGEAHALALAGRSPAPTVDEALTTLNERVVAAFENPDLPSSRPIVLMLGSSAPPTAPALPLTVDSTLSFIGSVLYGNWLDLTFPGAAGAYVRAAPTGACDYTPDQCQADVTADEHKAISNVVIRNSVILTTKLVLGLVEVFAPLSECVPLTSIPTYFARVSADCLADFITNSLNVDAPSCDGMWASPAIPTMATCWSSGLLSSCKAGACVPCIGAVVAGVSSLNDVLQAASGMVNGTCAVKQNYADSHERCAEPCSEACKSLSYEPSCGTVYCEDPAKKTGSVKCQFSSECVDHVTVIPAASSIPEAGATAFLAASIEDRNDLVCTDPSLELRWSSANTSIVSVSPAQGPSTTVTAVSPGGPVAVHVEEGLSGKQGQATIDVGKVKLELGGGCVSSLCKRGSEYVCRYEVSYSGTAQGPVGSGFSIVGYLGSPASESCGGWADFSQPAGEPPYSGKKWACSRSADQPATTTVTASGRREPYPISGICAGISVSCGGGAWEFTLSDGTRYIPTLQPDCRSFDPCKDAELFRSAPPCP